MWLTFPHRTGSPSVGGNAPLIGILALQGDVAEHREMLQTLGALTRDIRSPGDLAGLQGLVIPGGESSVMDKLVRRFGLHEPLQELISSGIPVLGTCAGLIMCATRLADGIEGQQTLGGLDVTVSRNAFGSQRDSFDTELSVSGLDTPVAVSFIRAPVVTEVGDGVDVRASLPTGEIVAVDNGQILGLSFHPEITGESRFHDELLSRAMAFSPAR